MATFGLFLNMGAFPGLSHQEILDAAISYAEAAEQLGYRDVWVSEHHFIPFGICPSALTMAGFLLGRTSRLRVGTATTLVHLYHPVQLAEQAALLDQLSGGRFDFGIGRGGYQREIEVFGAGPQRWEVEVDASLAVMRRAWTAETVASDSPLFPFPAVQVNPVPRTLPHPPVFLATRSSSTIDLAAREGLPLMLYWANDDDARVKILTEYAEAARRHGRDPAAAEHVVCVAGLVGDDATAARALMRRNLEWSFTAGDWPQVARPGVPEQRFDPLKAAAALAENGIVGEPAACVKRLRETIRRTAARRFVLMLENAGDRAATLEQIHRFAAQVLPEVPG
jgi:alkanesulfonate monooxygenase SsuD/methylene tetrahydromethanopterin reductase-like flavin-dependent oxidoreductase (luciferase family)